MAEDVVFSKGKKYLLAIKNQQKKDLAKNIAIAFFAAAVALFCQFYLNVFLGSKNNFVFLYIAVALSAWNGGLIAGLITTILGIIGLDVFFFPPVDKFSLEKLSPVNLIPLFIFLIGGIIVSLAIERSTNTKELRFYKRREKELMSLVAQQELDLAQAQIQVKARDEFLSIASHELKTPLTSMLLQIQSILHNIQHVSLAQFSVQNLMSKLQNAEVQTVRLSKMINDLLNVSLITTGKFTLEKENFDLSQLVLRVLDGFSEPLKKEEIKVKTSLEEKVVGHWDKIRIEQVITNLINNAIKYGNHKPISVAVKKKRGEAVLTVEDKGIGMNEEQQEQIFARFSRASNAKEFVGLGVGLYITKQIVEAHSGEITVDSYPDNGTTFTVLLPLSDKN